MKCTVIGEYDSQCRNISFPRIDMNKRTDLTFRNKTDSDHHKTTSPLERLPIDMVADFPIADPFHLVDLGIMKRCLLAWANGRCRYKTKWSARDITIISAKLEDVNQTLPFEIHRKVRRLDCIHFWKGLEFRTFLLYIGPAILKSHLSEEVYNHFLLFFCSITILSCKHHLRWINIAKKLLDDYIKQFIKIYGQHSISSNVHNLCHVVDDAEKFGDLIMLSSYPFENALGQIKHLIRSGNKPLAQAAKRCLEFTSLPPTLNTDHRKYPFMANKSATNVFKKIALWSM